MKSLNILLIICLFLFLSFSHYVSSAQCQSNIRLSKSMPPTTLSKDGQVEIEVKATGGYDLTLLSCDALSEKIIASKKGNGSDTFLFTKLEGDTMYKVIVDFHNEDKFLCMKRVITNIFLTDTK